MGVKDLASLFPIYLEAKKISEEYNLGFQFKIDHGSYETRIDISDLGTCFIGNGKLPLIGFDMFCPDLLDYHNKIILEYEETARPNKGAKRRKGHLEVNNHDQNRDWAYARAKFLVLKIWDSDKDWKTHLKKFLIETFTKSQNVGQS